MAGERDNISVDSYGSLDDIAAPISERLSAVGGDDPFSRLFWFGVHAAHLESGDEARFYLARTPSDRALLLLPLRADPKRRRLRAMTSVYSLGFAPIIAGASDGEARELLLALVRHIAQERPRWHRADIDSPGLPAKSLDRLLADMATAGIRGYRYLRGINHVCPLEGKGFEHWYQSRPSRLRNTLRRRERKLREAHDVAIEIVARPDETQLAAYQAVYGASWKEPEVRLGLFGDLVAALVEQGMLRLGLMRCDGAPVAAQIWIRCGTRAIIYKLAHDAAFDAWSPGSILTREMARSVIDEGGVSCLDFGIGDEAYKRDWMSDSRPLHGLVLYNTDSLAGRFGFGFRRLADRLRRLIRPLPKARVQAPGPP